MDVDFHCHLDLYSNPTEVAAEADSIGCYVLSVTTTPAAWEGNQSRFARFDRIKVALGLHPELIGSRGKDLKLFLELLPCAEYVGEVGIDGSSRFKSSIERQKYAFERVLSECANLGGRIMSIHSRGAEDEVLQMLEKNCGASVPVLHWFTGTIKQAKKAIQLGCWFSLGYPMLRSARGRRLLKVLPFDRVITETDGPFVAVKGKSMVPAEVFQVRNLLAEEWNLSEDEVEMRIRENFRRLMRSKPRMVRVEGN
ncbi:MAG: hydrolase TatD [Verrucomicrobiales bacterium]|nr:hydrolase TatD [Verrucomicrobiales bacterium]